MKLKYRIFRFGLLKRLHKGDRLMIFPTFRCPVQCHYCTLRYASEDGKMVTSSRKEELTLEEWKKLVLRFPKKIREIQISGGEPVLWPDYCEFVNWALDRGYFVTTFSSLWGQQGLGVRESVKYRIGATYHRNMDVEVFNENLKDYRAKYRVDVEEVETMLVPGSFTKPREYNEYGNTCIGFMHGPDGKLFYEFYTLVDHYKNKKKLIHAA